MPASTPRRSIADRPLTDIVPVQLMDDRGVPGASGERSYKVVTQYSMKPIEEIGLLKMDFLGLRNLDVIEDCLSIIEESDRRAPDMAGAAARRPEDLRDDGARRLGSACSSSSPTACARRWCGQAHRVRGPGRAERPLPAGAMPHRHLRAQQAQPRVITYLDERLRLITEATYSVILYQEQSMQIAKSVAASRAPRRTTCARRSARRTARRWPRCASASRARARAAPGERDRGAVGRQRGGGRLLFNRSHAACYGLIGYRTAWLKANYPAEYMAALISSVMSTKDKVPLRRAVRGHGHRGAAARRELSGHDFKVVDGNIRFGLDAVKGSATRRSRRSSGPRGGRPFTSVGLLPARRLPGGQQEGERRSSSAARWTAARDAHRHDAVLPNAQAAGAQMQQDAQRGQGVLFDLDGRARRRVGARPAGPRAARRARAAERVGEGDARPVPRRAIRSRRCGRRSASAWTARSTTLLPRRRTASGSLSAA